MNMCSIESHFALEARIDSLTAERDEAITRLLDEQKTHSETFLRLAAAERVVEAARTTRHAIAGLHRASWDDSGETDVHRQLLLDAEHNLLEQLIGYEKAYSSEREVPEGIASDRPIERMQHRATDLNKGEQS